MKLHHTVLCMQSLLIIITGVHGIEKQKLKLVFSTSKYLKEIDLDTGVVQTLTTQNEKVFSMAYDKKERYMYVPRFSTGDIVRFSYPTNHTVMLETTVSTMNPFGIAFDSVNRQLYWTEISSGRIKRCNPDGSNVTILVNEAAPTALSLDTRNRWIYYGQEQYPSKIFRTNFDGMDKRVIIKNVLSWVYGIGVDVDVERIYWMEYHTGDLQSAFFNGSDVITISFKNAIKENWDVHINEGVIFYTSGSHIIMINKINKNEFQTQSVHTDTDQMYGIFVYKQDGENIIIEIL